MSDTGGQVDTRSVLFTDLVGSTELRVELGEEQADALRRRHDELLSATITAHGGTVVKGLGDGVMATFAAAADAVAAAVAIQQAVHTERFAIRVGLSIGDVSVENDDVFGVPVVEASRLCAIAAAGEILAAELVRALARGRGGFVFEPMGDLELKGLPDPVPSTRVIWEPLVTNASADQDGDGVTVPIPSGLLGGISATYVGRTALLDQLEEHWARTAAGSTRAVLLAGEPGVGKTRTAGELAKTVHQRGGLVLYGRCEEGLGAPYQPFVEALDHYTAHATAAPTLGRLPGELARLLPDLANRVAGLAKPAASDPGSEEHRLFEATTSWLIDLGQQNEQGVMLVLDDLHWATKPTLLLVLHLLRAASEQQARLLVVVTYRDTDIDRAHPLSSTLADLRRLPAVERTPVDNLTEAEVVALMEAAAGHEMDPAGIALAGAVYAETEGNPFFVTEVLRHLVETGGVRREGERFVTGADLEHLAIPEGVRDVIGRRLSRLSEAANDVLSTGAVMGRELEVDVLVALSDGGEDAVLDALDEAVRARLVEETGVDRFRFAHALVRTTLYEELSATRRRRLHRRIADAIEKLRPADFVALAYHCAEGGPEGGDISRAVRYGLAAAEQSLSGRAFADAEARFLAVLDMLEDHEEAWPPERVAALIGLGEAQRDQGDQSFRSTLLDASRRALELGLTSLLVRAVLANSRGMASIVGDIDRERIELIEAALAAVDPGPSDDRARLLANLGAEMTFSGEHSQRLALSDEAEAMARSLDDPALLSWVLTRTSYATVTGPGWERLVERTAEGTRLADALGADTLGVINRIFESGALLTAGRIAEADAVMESGIALAAECSPSVQWFIAANTIRLSHSNGGVAEAERRNLATLERGQAIGENDALQWWGAAAAGLAFLRGTSGEMADAAGVFAETYPLLPAWRGGQAWMLADAGRLDEAAAVIDGFGLREWTFEDEPLPFCVPFQLSYVASMLGDVPLATPLADTMSPYRELWCHYYMFVIGPMTWPLGLCRSLLGAHDEAVALLDDTIAKLGVVGYVDHVTRARIDLARVLQARGGPGDGERAARELAAARAAADTAGAPALVTRIDTLLA